VNVRLANTTATPVALHLPDGVVIVAARGVVECSEQDAATSQVTALCRRGVLVARRVAPPPPSESAAKPRRRAASRRRPTT
jgi:hypothetical protein